MTYKEEVRIQKMIEGVPDIDGLDMLQAIINEMVLSPETRKRLEYMLQVRNLYLGGYKIASIVLNMRS